MGENAKLTVYDTIGRGVITGMQLLNDLIMNGTPRHILGLRHMVHARNKCENVEHGSKTAPTQRLLRDMT